MKVYIGTMYRIIIERKCGCRAAQEFKDAIMKDPDGEPNYKPCDKHKKGAAGEIIEDLMFEVLENKAEEHRSKSTIAIAEANAEKRAGNGSAPVSEGATSETRTPVRVAAPKTAAAPGAAPVSSAAPSGNVPNQPRPQVGVRAANLVGGSKSGLRRAVAPTRQTVAAKVAAQAPQTVQTGDIQTDPVAEDPRVTAILVDDPEGGLLGAFGDESEA
jgi:hypothetical protein